MMTYSKLDRSREEFDTSGLGNFLATSNAWQVDESRLDNALLALGSLDDGLGKSEIRQSSI